MAERMHLGYLLSGMIFAALIVIVIVAHYGFKANAVLTFWAAYILTRPLGASIADYLIQAKDDGGLGLGTVAINGSFLAGILVIVAYLAITKKDVAPARIPE